MARTWRSQIYIRYGPKKILRQEPFEAAFTCTVLLRRRFREEFVLPHVSFSDLGRHFFNTARVKEEKMAIHVAMVLLLSLASVCDVDMFSSFPCDMIYPLKKENQQFHCLHVSDQCIMYIP